jgi:hypothetical protein
MYDPNDPLPQKLMFLRDWIPARLKEGIPLEQLSTLTIKVDVSAAAILSYFRNWDSAAAFSHSATDALLMSVEDADGTQAAAPAQKFKMQIGCTKKGESFQRNINDIEVFQP